MNELRDCENDLRAALRHAEQAVREPQDLAERLIRRTTQRCAPRRVPLFIQATRPARRRARPRRTRPLIPLAAAAAVVAVVTGLAIAASLLGASNRQPGGTSPLWPGVPRFYVEALKINPLEVYDTATGQVVATIQAPKGTLFDGQVVALAGDRTFLTAASPGSLSTDLGPCITRLYKFQLNDAGQPGPLIPLPITVPGEPDVSNSLSVTPDGRMIAYATDLGCRPIAGSWLEIGVINLATRRVRSWTLRQQSGGDVIYSAALSADGRELVFSEGSFPSTGPATTVARILPTSAPPGSFDQRSTVVPGSADWSWVALNADGGLLYACSRPLLGVLAGGRTTGATTYSIDSIASSRRQVIASWPPQQYPICGASLDTSGRYLLIQLVKQASEPNRLVLVDLRTGQLRNIRRGGPSPGIYGGIAASIAW
jgi:hypothetical protein